MTATESTDVLVIGSGFGGAIAAYHLAAGGARVVVLERGPWLEAEDYDQDFQLGSSSTRIFEFTVCDGMSVLGGNCVGGGSVVYFATMPRAPRYIFERQGSIGRRLWPQAISRGDFTESKPHEITTTLGHRGGAPGQRAARVLARPASNEPL